MFYIIDRTKNPKGKSLPNTERFLNRVRAQIKSSIADLLKKAKIAEALGGDDNSIHVHGNILHEPSFKINSGKSDWIRVLPGNPLDGDRYILNNFNPNIFKNNEINPFINQYIEKDEIEKPPEGSGGPHGSKGGNGTDDFIFSLDRKEWEKFLWDELALPNQDDSKAILVLPEWRKAGYIADGSPANLALLRTAKNSFSRRIAFNRPTDEQLTELLAQTEKATSEQELNDIMKLVEEMKARMSIIPWIDPMDVKYHSYRKEMRPKFNAVMFALMDVSGSMTEDMKDLAKRFYIVLYSFLKSRYDRVEIIFIRHTHEAKEVDEQTFFYDPESGGTVVSEAIKLMDRIIKNRYPLSDWNIYGAQCSDGDNSYSDDVLVKETMDKSILPVVQHFVYVQIRSSWGYGGETDLWKTYEPYAQFNNFDMAKIKDRDDIWPLMLKVYPKDRGSS